ncbi:MAG: DUF4430 domain-containing protein [Christensenellales bacterium]|nr:DUF4430 domain-containing protein [Christensenellales bacterium]
MNENTNSTRRSIAKKALALLALLLVVVAMIAVYFHFSEKPVAGSKAITIEVLNSLSESTQYSLKTDADYLRQAMEETEGLEFSGTEGQYGLMVTTVNGETADYNTNGAYWSFSVNGEYCNYGVDQQPVEDGDAFVIAYTK